VRHQCCLTPGPTPSHHRGTVSFGQTMIAQLLDVGTEEVGGLSREPSTATYATGCANTESASMFGDVRELNSVGKPPGGVGYAFHAAVLKQMPSASSFPRIHPHQSAGRHQRHRRPRTQRCQAAVFSATTSRSANQRHGHQHGHHVDVDVEGTGFARNMPNHIETAR
jgi:hypothetical protein